jgi:hypothetical protein
MKSRDRYITAWVIVLLLSVPFSAISQKSKGKNEIVYITRKGNKYHRDSCRYLSKSKIAIVLDEAKKYYKACSVCKPDSLR